MSTLWKDNILVLRGGAAAADVARIHVWQIAQGILAAGELCAAVTTRSVTFDGDTSTVHVHLSVANKVEPGPCKEDLVGRRGVFGNLETVGLFERTSMLHGFDNFPSITVVIGERNLA